MARGKRADTRKGADTKTAPRRVVDLAHLSPAPGSRKKRKRVGRGPGSGHGKTATRGYKGQRSRGSGKQPYFGFEGGQMPLHRRIPKRGFTNIFRRTFEVVNVGALEKLDGEVTPEALLGAGLVRKKGAEIKILGDGDLKKALVVKAHKFSRQAMEKIAAAGGRAEILKETAGPAKS
jgi:large subunit ribosomal protein L15